MPNMNQPKFMEQYSAHPPTVSSDFKKADGTPATWAPNMPCFWGSESKVLKFEDEVTSFALSLDDALIAIAIEKTIHIYNINTLALVQVLAGHTGDIGKMEFAPKSRKGYTLVSSSSGSRDSRSPTIIWWDLDDEGKDLHPSQPVDVTKIAKQASDHVLKYLEWPEASETSQALQADFKTALAAAVARKGLEGRTTFSGKFSSFGSEVFSRDAKHLIIIGAPPFDSTPQSSRNYVEIYDVEKKTLLHTLKGHTDNIVCVAVSPDSKLLASVAWDGHVRIWSLETGECLHTFGDFGGQMWTGVWSPDSKYLAFSQGSPKTIVYVYCISTFREVSRFENIKNWARSFDWSPDGKLLASGTSHGGMVCVWDAMTGEEKMRWELKFEDEEKMMAYFIGTGRVRFVGWKLVFQTTEGTIEGFDFETGLKSEWKMRETDVVRTMGSTMKVSSGGRFLVSADGDKSVRFWDIE